MPVVNTVLLSASGIARIASFQVVWSSSMRKPFSLNRLPNGVSLGNESWQPAQGMKVKSDEESGLYLRAKPG